MLNRDIQFYVTRSSVMNQDYTSPKKIYVFLLPSYTPKMIKCEEDLSALLNVQASLELEDEKLVYRIKILFPITPIYQEQLLTHNLQCANHSKYSQ